MKRVSVVYFEADATTADVFSTTTPRVAEGMVHNDIAEASIGSQVEKIIEMDDVFGTVNPITKLLWVNQEGAQDHELLDIDQLTEIPEGDTSVTVVVTRQQEQLNVSQFCMSITMKASALSIDSFETKPNQCLRLLDKSCCKAPKGGLRRLWPGDVVVEEEATATFILESIPSATQIRAVPPDAFSQFGLSTSCDPVAVFEGSTVSEVAALDRQRSTMWRGFAAPCGRATYMKNNNLKEAVRHGIPASRRALVYADIAGVESEAKSGMNLVHFESTLRSVFHLAQGQRLPKRYEPRYPPHLEGNLGTAKEQYGLNSDGVRNLKLILCAIAELHQDVMSCPLAVPIASLLLHYMAPEDAFASIDTMIRSSRHKNISARLYFLRISQVEHVSQAAIAAELIKRRLPRITAIFQELGISLGATLLDTINVFFTNVLPPPFVWRIMDAFLNEGNKVLIRYCVALIKHLELRIFNCETSYDLMNLFAAGDENGCRRTITVQQFHNMCNFAFNISLARQELDSLDTHCIGATEELLSSTYSPDNFSESLRKRPILATPYKKNTVSLDPLFLWTTDGVGVQTKWAPLFSASTDGWSLSTLYRCCSERYKSSQIIDERIIILLGIASGPIDVVGIVINACPSAATGSYQGSEATFAFTIGRSEHKYPATGTNKYFLLTEQGNITLGGGGDDAPQPMLRLSDDLQTATSYPCPTFDTPAFATSDDNLVHIESVDIYQVVS